MTGLVNKMLDYLASTHFGQYIIKKVDLLLWSIEKPAKYSVDGKSSGDSPSLPWPIFWIILINLQIYRLVFSTILIQLNKYPIESIDVVKGLQKWRRTLRSIRFRGLRRIREKQYGTSIDGDVTASPPPKETSKKRNHDEMLDHDLLDELMNHTYSDTDNTDSTFMISKFADISTNGSSNYGQSLSEDYQSPLKSKDSLDSSLQDTLPVSASESEHQEPNMSTKTNEGTFVSTVDDTEESAFALTEEDSGHSVNGNAMHSNGSRSTEPTTAQSNGTKKVGKESLNATDPVDVMILKMVELEQNGKLNTKKSGKNKNKKRNFSLSSQENIDRQISAKASKSQESLNQL